MGETEREAEDMIRTWIADIKELTKKEKYLQYYKKVPEFRREKADRILSEGGKALSVGAWTLLEMMRSEYGVKAEAVYNLSHSGDYALCSIDDCGRTDIMLGCDVEGIKEMREGVAKRFFCESEFRYIMRQKTEKKRAEEFYRYWVLKESFMKATRLGMKLGLDRFEIQVAGEERPRLLRQPEEFPEMFFFQEYEIEGIAYKIAVCSNADTISKEIKHVIL